MRSSRGDGWDPRGPRINWSGMLLWSMVVIGVAVLLAACVTSAISIIDG